MHRNKVELDSVWKDGFLFLGNQRALDFLNTCPVQNGVNIELLPDFNALVRWFQAAELLSPHTAANLLGLWVNSPRARRAVEAMRELRERLRKDVVTWEHGGTVPHSTVNELNRLMAEHPMRTRFKADACAPTLEPWFEANEPEDLFAPLAHSTAELFAHADRARVRQCGECVLHFHDTSKKGTRRWCSMQLCGNRLKVAAYADRQRRLTRKTKKSRALELA